MKGWYTHFRLTDDPFDASGERFRYYYGARYGVFSLRLERAFEQQRSFVLVTGPAGTGKSTLVRSTLARADVCAHATVSVAQCAPVSVIDALLHSREPFRTGFSATRKRAALLALIERARETGRPIVCVIDDAHLATSGQLKELFTAVNVTADAHMILQIVLVGRSRLLLTLQSRTLAALATRMATRIETGPLSPAEVTDYLTERLESAGAPDPDAILPSFTMTAIARHSRGSIAIAGTLARAALTRAAEAGVRSVSCELVDETAAVYAGPPSDAARLSTARITSAATSTAAIGLIVLALVIAAAQIEMAGRKPVAVEANVVHLGGAHGTRADNTAVELAQQHRSPRETFLVNRPYEVQIKPPRRPGQEEKSATKSSETPASVKPRTGEPSAEKPVISKGTSDSSSTLQPSTIPPPREQTARDAGETPTSAPPTKVVVPAISKPWVSLQVGAFRNLKSAHGLQRKLARTFSDVYISTVESGGEPLFRVRVGRFRTAEDTLALKTRLQTAGYPSFRVTER